jgi:hypothetical protein
MGSIPIGVSQELEPIVPCFSNEGRNFSDQKLGTWRKYKFSSRPQITLYYQIVIHVSIVCAVGIRSWLQMRLSSEYKRALRSQ